MRPLWGASSAGFERWDGIGSAWKWRGAIVGGQGGDYFFGAFWGAVMGGLRGVACLRGAPNMTPRESR